MCTRRDKRERKKREKKRHTHRGHVTRFYFYFLLHRWGGRRAVKRCQVVTGRQATVIDASSPAVCVFPLFASSEALFCPLCCVLTFHLGILLPPTPGTVSSFTCIMIVCLCGTSAFIKNTTLLFCSRGGFFFLSFPRFVQGLRRSFHLCVRVLCPFVPLYRWVWVKGVVVLESW